MKKLLLVFTMVLLALLSIRSWAGQDLATEDKSSTTTLDTTAMQSTNTLDATAMHIDVGGTVITRHQGLKDEVAKALDTFKTTRDFGEVSIQGVMHLLEAEVCIVDLLLEGHTGYAVERAVLKRNKKLSHSIPSVAYMYDKIVDVATYNDLLNRKIYKHTQRDQKAFKSALNIHDKKIFLREMKDKLVHYYTIMHTMQCELAMGSGRSDSTVAIGSKGYSMGFCPIIK